MPRRSREDIEECLYHVIARGNDRRKIFFDADDCRFYLQKIRAYAKRYDLTFYACCLMPNHVHFLIKRGKFPLSKFMQGLQQSYTAYFNRKHKKVGHLFQGRYKAILCDGDVYFLELVRYIHLNPIRAGIASGLNDYRWSSHHAFRGKKEWDFIATKFVLDQTGGRRNYFSLINDGLNEGYREDLHEVKEQLYLGDDRFVEKVESSVRAPVPPVFNVSLAELAYEVEQYFQLKDGSVHSPSRSRHLTPARDWLLYLNHSLAKFSHRELSIFLGRDPSRLSRQWNHFLERLHHDSNLRIEAEKLAHRIRKSLALYPRRKTHKSISQA
ncbi:MAG: transposase [Deltaproteobacteria bacterium]|nr:transposase [Deltaproteobacteria bacterium]MBI4373991.1 transposase [Deltaproteobacteria bacterium]